MNFITKYGSFVLIPLYVVIAVVMHSVGFGADTWQYFVVMLSVLAIDIIAFLKGVGRA